MRFGASARAGFWSAATHSVTRQVAAQVRSQSNWPADQAVTVPDHFGDLTPWPHLITDTKSASASWPKRRKKKTSCVLKPPRSGPMLTPSPAKTTIPRRKPRKARAASRADSFYPSRIFIPRSAQQRAQRWPHVIEHLRMRLGQRVNAIGLQPRRGVLPVGHPLEQKRHQCRFIFLCH